MSLYPWDQNAGKPSPEQMLNPTPVRRINTLTQPAAEPVDAASMATVLKVSSGDEGDYLTALLVSSRAWCENYTGRFFITHDAELWLDFWPPSGEIEVPCSPITVIGDVSTWGDDDIEQIMDPASYQTDKISEPGRVALRDGIDVPSGLRRINAVRVKFTAGWPDAASVPENIKTAIRSMAAEVYLARGNQVDARDFVRNSVASKDCLMLLEPYKVLR